jgi:hypothetical protein
MIYIENKKKKEKTLTAKYPNAKILDVTSKSDSSLVKLSPFFPHGDIPVPFTENMTSKSVEGLWQALKVFESDDVDVDMMLNTSMKNIKRTVRKFGQVLGHRKGVYGKELLNYIDARIQIYLPSYLWVLENKVDKILKRLKDLSNESDIVLLDYETNCDILNSKKPLSHAFLVKSYLDGNYPKSETLYNELEMKLNNPTLESPTKKKAPKSKKNNPINPNQQSLF